jgi:hypothetical protein
MDFPHGVMVTLRSVTTTPDDLGNTTEETVETQWGPCAVAPRASAESTDPRSPAVIVGLTVYGPPVDIDADDLLVIDGEAYQVDGLPGVWRSPFTGWEPGIEVAVKRAS